MLENENQPYVNPGLILICTFFTVAAGFIVIGPLLGTLIALPFFKEGPLALVEALQNPTQHPEIKMPLYIVQGGATFFGLIAGPMLMLKALKLSPYDLFRSRLYATPLILTPIIVIVFMSVNSLFIEWNANAHFPEFLKGFEDWARAKEDYAAEITKFLTHFDSIGEVIVAMMVIAVLPAIGEELVFRGLIQNELMRASRNIHVSIWVAAFLFSAIHMQFFGFVPRILLGALFGYLYYWSGSLVISMLAHFINNGFAVIGLYLYQQGKLNFDVGGNEAAPWPAILSSAVLTIALLYYFRKYYREQRTPAEG